MIASEARRPHSHEPGEAQGTASAASFISDRPCHKKNPARNEARRIDFQLQITTTGSARGRPRRAVARIALEEQRLAGDGGDHRGLERFRDQERRLGALAGQEAFGVGGDEHHRDLEHLQQLVDRVQPRRAVGGWQSAGGFSVRIRQRL